MYFYYFLTTLGIRPAWKVLVTNGQIVQFVFSFACSVPFVRTHGRARSSSLHSSALNGPRHQ